MTSSSCRRYFRDGSQAAFAELVHRHVNLVYSTAYRLIRDGHLAEDVTQQVFTLLARKGARLAEGTVIPAWLYRSARHIARDALRREHRRQHREQAAAEDMTSAAEPAWQQIEPLLDEAMGALRATDHDVLVLRYLENRSLKEVAAALGSNEDAAQKRVARALERLRHHLARRGVTVSLGGLTAAIGGHAVQSAPAGLAASAVSASLAAGASTGLIAVLADSMTKTKLALVVAGATLAVLTVPLVVLFEHNCVLRHQIAEIEASAREAAQTNSSNKAVRSEGGAEELRRLRLEHLELLALRGRVAQMALERQKGNSNATVQDLPADQTGDSIFFTAASTNRVPNGSTLVVGGWSRDGLRGYVLLTPAVTNHAQLSAEPGVILQSQMVGAPDQFWQQIGWGQYASGTHRSTLAGVLRLDQADALIQALRDTDQAWLSNTSTATNRDGELFGVSWAVDGEPGDGVLMKIDLYPRVASDGRSVDVELRPPARTGPEATIQR